MSVKFVLFSFLLISTPVQAEQIPIGHLETSDDKRLNWLNFDCYKTGNTLNCNVIETTLTRKAPTGKADKNSVFESISKLIDKNSCAKVLEKKDILQKGLVSNIGVDGKPLDPRIMRVGTPLMNDTIKFCENRTPENADNFVKSFEYIERNTCVLHNTLKSLNFVWNDSSGSWINQIGPDGPCGITTISTLKQQTPNLFFDFTDQVNYTYPNGIAVDGKSCKALIPLTRHYTYNVNTTAESCEFIESDQD